MTIFSSFDLALRSGAGTRASPSAFFTQGQRLKSKVSGTPQQSRPFQVGRWRLDESEDYSRRGSSLASERTKTTHNSSQLLCTYTDTPGSIAERVVVLRGLPPTAPSHPPLTLDHQPFTFPLSSDHLLHLIQYNVFRALIFNKRTLNTLPSDPTACLATGPYIDDTILYPLNSHIPPSLAPTTLQQTRYHSIWINVIPFPRMRDNLIRYEGRFDPWELMQDLVGELMSPVPALWQRGKPSITNVPDVMPLTLPSGSDTDEVTPERKGLIVWGEPHEMQSWEATPGFLAKWTWTMQGCQELIEASNYWRLKRGEEPLRLSVLRNYPLLPPLSHAEEPHHKIE
ncbi:dihydrosphingosine 1-phosphate phosphatase [Fusarium pseudocircinatum]|uniref:Dihydrosphingosine 1-phosphate phosphatase n=1 Tax=Fusarium pseudocircinatum TaxID=56676 RepID=A0A8H5PLC3_9HYPO|nr:dihydrosphingosine 1-phosphate phosphatase [Fusarium pseudocircinatum]